MHTDFGDLLSPDDGGFAAGNSTRGLLWYKFSSQQLLNTIEYITIASTGDTIDFGDLTKKIWRNGTQILTEQGQCKWWMQNTAII